MPVEQKLQQWWQHGRDWIVEHATLPEFLREDSPQDWLLAVGIAAVLFLLAKAVIAFVARRVKTLTARTSIGWDDSVSEALSATRWWFILAVALYCGASQLHVEIREFFEHVAIIALILQGVSWGNVLLQFALTRFRKGRIADDPAAVTTVSALTFLGRLALWSVALLLILENLGVDVTALVAGLGVGGIAVALAAQNILGDLFASMSIVLDKPFVYGDFIIVGDLMGTVENIGLKTTRVRSLSGEQLIFSNTDLLQSRIRNYKRMQERRIVFGFGVEYATPVEQLEEIPPLVERICNEVRTARFPALGSDDPTTLDQVRFDRCHFKEYGDFSLNFEVVYYVLSADYNVYMDLQQAINLALYREFDTRGIEFAFPTQTILLGGDKSQESRDNS